MLLDERLEFFDELVARAKLELRIDQGLGGEQTEVFEALGLEPQCAFGVDAVKRPSAPKRERSPQPLRAPLGGAPRKRLPPFVNQPLEPREVHVLLVDT